MFIPIGGVFVFGGCHSRGCVISRIIMGFFNLIMGVIAITFGYTQDFTILKVIGFIIAGVALLMIITNLFRLRRTRPANEPKTF